MGDWRKDQSKTVRRYIWGETRGQNDTTWQDFANRIKTLPALAPLKHEKLGSEIHCWRQVLDAAGKPYWISCLRFVADDWGYWTVSYRKDEGRWRATDIQKLPVGRAVTAAAEWYASKMQV
jgi:hypothetical protein